MRIPIAAKRAVAGKSTRVFGDPHAPHSMTDVRDMAVALVTVAAEPSAWGRVWHAPTNPARSQAETLDDVCRAIGPAAGEVRSWPAAMLSVGGLVVPLPAGDAGRPSTSSSGPTCSTRPRSPGLRAHADPVGRGVPGDR